MIIVVSGLPRSGTSLMMQALHAGGVPALRNQAERYDNDNPNGYWELSGIHKVGEHPELIAANESVNAPYAVKILWPWLPQLDKHKHGPACVLWMNRNPWELVDSQNIMRVRRGQPVPAQPNTNPAAWVNACLDVNEHEFRKFKTWRNTTAYPVLEVDHNEAVLNPLAEYEAVAAWLYRFGRAKLNFENMATAVNQHLYRNRYEVPVSDAVHGFNHKLP